jgi:hypothetical protein
MQTLKSKYYNLAAPLVLFLLGGVFLFYSCKTVSGLKSPQWETDKTIQQKIEKHKLDLANSCMLANAKEIAKF